MSYPCMAMYGEPTRGGPFPAPAASVAACPQCMCIVLDETYYEIIDVVYIPVELCNYSDICLCRCHREPGSGDYGPGVIANPWEYTTVPPRPPDPHAFLHPKQRAKGSAKARKPRVPGPPPQPQPPPPVAFPIGIPLRPPTFRGTAPPPPPPPGVPPRPPPFPPIGSKPPISGAPPRPPTPQLHAKMSETASSEPQPDSPQRASNTHSTATSRSQSRAGSFQMIRGGTIRVSGTSLKLPMPRPPPTPTQSGVVPRPGIMQRLRIFRGPRATRPAAGKNEKTNGQGQDKQKSTEKSQKQTEQQSEKTTPASDPSPPQVAPPEAVAAQDPPAEAKAGEAEPTEGAAPQAAASQSASNRQRNAWPPGSPWPQYGEGPRTPPSPEPLIGFRLFSRGTPAWKMSSGRLPFIVGWLSPDTTLRELMTDIFSGDDMDNQDPTLVEVVRQESGNFTRGLSYRYRSDDMDRTLRDLGWPINQGTVRRPPVWLAWGLGCPDDA